MSEFFFDPGPLEDQVASGAKKTAPPPPEISVRTLASDLDSIRLSGGAPPEFQNVPLEHKEPGAAPQSRSWLLWVIFLGALVAAFFVGYFLL